MHHRAGVGPGAIDTNMDQALDGGQSVAFHGAGLEVDDLDVLGAEFVVRLPARRNGEHLLAPDAHAHVARGPDDKPLLRHLTGGLDHRTPFGAEPAGYDVFAHVHLTLTQKNASSWAPSPPTLSPSGGD